MLPILFPILVFLAVVCIGGAIVAAAASRRRSLEPRLRSIAGGFSLPVDDPRSGRGSLAGTAASIGGLFFFGRPSMTLKEQLARAGYHGDTAAATFLGVKFLLLALGALGATALTLWLELPTSLEIYGAVAIAGVMFFIPNLVVRAKRLARCAEVRQHLPDVVDLLEICVSAGMGLDMAWNAVSDEIRPVSPVLADEMALTMLETQLGAPRTAAMRHMADRTGAKELASLVALLVQSDRFGTSVADALRTFASSMRDIRSQRAEEEAERTAVKLLFPLVFCIFPVVLIVMVGPAGITLYKLITSSQT